MQSINPATGKEGKTYTTHDAAAVEKALATAEAQFRQHRKRSFEERAEWMRRAAELLKGRRDRYAVRMTEEMGKTLESARSEVEKCAWVCSYYADHAASFLADEHIETDAGESYVSFQPIGPVLAVMPWNFPFWQVFRFAAPALMAGNVGLLKHASNVPGSALAIEEVFRDAGFPEGCFQTLLIGSDAVADIIADKRVAAVTLTGSEGAGKSVATAAGDAIKKVVLELGGSDPFIVMPSADLDSAVETAVTARMINNGQSCIAAKRFILHKDISEAFTERFVEKVRGLNVGDPMEDSTDIGPLARGEFVDDLIRQIEESRDAGAKILTGGSVVEGPGFFVEPTVLGNVRPGMPAFDQETFGPVAALIEADDLDDAIALANATPFGLGAAAWTEDPGERRRFIEEIASGSVFLNGMVKSDPRLPFGGVKASGIGRELGVFGIREFVNIKTVWIA